MRTIYERDFDNDGLTDAQELALGTNLLTPDSDGDGKPDLTEIEEGSNPMSPDFERIKASISSMMENHYKEFIQALMSIELGINNPQDLEELYRLYMEQDDLSLLSDGFEEVKNQVNEMDVM